jgi:hypothetical protein
MFMCEPDMKHAWVIGLNKFWDITYFDAFDILVALGAIETVKFEIGRAMVEHLLHDSFIFETANVWIGHVVLR